MILELYLTFIALIVFAFFDYFGYNVLHKIQPTVCGITQHALLIAIAAILYFLAWQCTVAFILLWWTWWADAIYYVFADSFRWYHKAGDRWQAEAVEDRVTWAWWTPMGLMLPYKMPMPYTTLLRQLIIGMALALIIMSTLLI